jgi:hypothetical protein
MDRVSVVMGALLAVLVAFVAGCIVTEPREGYYDRDHHRFYGGHAWHDCGDHDDHCR